MGHISDSKTNAMPRSTTRQGMPCRTLAGLWSCGSGKAARRLFAAHSRAIGKKSKAADRPRPCCHRPQGVTQGISRPHITRCVRFVNTHGNPFEFRAALKPEQIKAHELDEGLNHFEFRATLKRMYQMIVETPSVLIPLNSGLL